MNEYDSQGLPRNIELKVNSCHARINAVISIKSLQLVTRAVPVCSWSVTNVLPGFCPIRLCAGVVTVAT